MNRKPIGRKFVKGQVTNPLGAGAHNKDLKRIKRLTHHEVAEVGSILLDGNKESLERIAKDPNVSALKTWMAGIALDGIKYKNMNTLDVLLNRVIGKVKEDNKVTIVNGGSESFTDNEAIEAMKKAQEKC